MAPVKRERSASLSESDLSIDDGYVPAGWGRPHQRRFHATMDWYGPPGRLNPIIDMRSPSPDLNGPSNTSVQHRKDDTNRAKYDDPNADMVLVSDDGVKFRVDSFALRGASDFFRDMFTTLPLGENTVTDEPILIAADQHVTRFFVDLICNNPVPSQKLHTATCGNGDIRVTGSESNYTGKDFLEVHALLEKFDCRKGLLERLIYHARRALKSDPWTVFCLAAYAEDLETVKLAIQDFQYAPREAQMAIRPDRMSEDKVRLAPLPYYMAYNRAYIRAMKSPGRDQPKWSQVAREFSLE